MSTSTTDEQPPQQACSDTSPSPSVRRSLRGVKKKKLDDGMVDSAMIGSRRHLQPSDRKPIDLDSLSSAGSSLTSSASPGTLVKARSRTRKCHSKALRQKGLPAASLTRGFTMKDANGWQPTDDLALICAVEWTNDLVAVHRLVAFSSKFSLSEIESRWYDLLYDPVTSRLSQERMQSLKPEVVKEIESSTPFSDTENRCLASISSTVQPSLEALADAIKNHKDTFFHGRTPASLQKQWLTLKKHDLLEDCKNGSNLSARDHRRNPAFGSIPFNSSGPLNDALISRADAERNKLPVGVEHLPDANWTPSPSTLAVLRGRVVQYLIRSPEVVLGHGGMYPFYGVDLSCEGPCWKIGQRQAVIRWRPTGEWWLSNEGHTPITIDGLPCVGGAKAKLSTNSVVEICQIRLLFIDMNNNSDRNAGHTNANATDSLVA